ncbi:MAG TPA: hypothetical protein VJJ47_03540 [Candidatus Paceibacterota bacterium]
MKKIILIWVTASGLCLWGTLNGSRLAELFLLMFIVWAILMVSIWCLEEIFDLTTPERQRARLTRKLDSIVEDLEGLDEEIAMSGEAVVKLRLMNLDEPGRRDELAIDERRVTRAKRRVVKLEKLQARLSVRLDRIEARLEPKVSPKPHPFLDH